MLMKIIRWLVAALTVLVTIIFIIVLALTSITTDRTIPSITVEDGILDVSVTATDEDLMKGVTAYDGKDGDITSEVFVESISKFSEIGYCKVTYAVCDADNHVTSATRQIHYTDYVPPKFKMQKPLIFSSYNTFNIFGTVGATDCLDGDISQNVIVYSPDYEEDTIGTFTLQATVTNSKGDSSVITLPMTIEKQAREAPVIVLDEYLIYVKKGAPTPNWAKYIVETVDSTGIDANLKISVKTDFDSKKAGTYIVNYYGVDSKESTGHTALIAVVE